MTNIPSDLIDLIRELIIIEDKKLADQTKEILYEELRIPLEEFPTLPSEDKPKKIEISLE